METIKREAIKCGGRSFNLVPLFPDFSNGCTAMEGLGQFSRALSFLLYIICVEFIYRLPKFAEKPCEICAMKFSKSKNRTFRIRWTQLFSNGNLSHWLTLRVSFIEPPASAASIPEEVRPCVRNTFTYRSVWSERTRSPLSFYLMMIITSEDMSYCFTMQSCFLMAIPRQTSEMAHSGG
ncbi:hypothetical protein OUZ56_007273 [Daphnia magna]|uniref:Uncharacterized protein n=1 Tax=Daphnia magna TaxID=35525 RepID=A0ABQ9YY49_9CRUS|nr:hypothetical protein OUZ56_007273 [Daphnia magna]